jgi:hypothetical protein
VNELTCAKEKSRDDFVTLQQMEQKHKQSETNLRMELNELEQLKEENVRFCSRVRRLNKRIRSSEKEAKRRKRRYQRCINGAESHEIIAKQDELQERKVGRAERKMTSQAARHFDRTEGSRHIE